MTAQPQPSRTPPSELPAALETIVRRFEAAWQSGSRPDLDAALAGLADADRATALVELVHAELELRLKAGAPARVEDYLRRYPELAGQAAVVVDLVAREYRQRSRGEPALAFDEYLTRFPHLEADLRALMSGVTTRTGPPAAGGGVTTGHGVPAGTRRAGAAGAAAAPAIPGYEILGELGRGGMGVVYKARHLELNRLVALKMIRVGDAGEAEVARFRGEALALARLQHPNIVQVYDVGLYQGQPFLSLEDVEGGSLNQRLAGGPQPAREAAELVRVLAGAVHAAHQAGIIHRDLKPANVLVGPQRLLKVTDFGLAKQLDADSGQTRTGQVMGTPCYMAPEQAVGDLQALGRATDVYALGAILYECLTGRPLFRGVTVLETLDQVRTQEPVPPRLLNARAPRDLELICLQCLRKEPARRYGSALDLADDLRRFLDGEPIKAKAVGPVVRAWKWLRRRPLRAALAGMAVLVTVLTFTIVYYRGRVEQVRRVAEEQKLLNNLATDFEAGLEAAEWTPAYLERMEALLARLEELAPDQAATAAGPDAGAARAVADGGGARAGPADDVPGAAAGRPAAGGRGPDAGASGASAGGAGAALGRSGGAAAATGRGRLHRGGHGQARHGAAGGAAPDGAVLAGSGPLRLGEGVGEGVRRPRPAVERPAGLLPGAALPPPAQEAGRGGQVLRQGAGGGPGRLPAARAGPGRAGRRQAEVSRPAP
jgi:hypothetical protein